MIAKPRNQEWITNFLHAALLWIEQWSSQKTHKILSPALLKCQQCLWNFLPFHKCHYRHRGTLTASTNSTIILFFSRRLAPSSGLYSGRYFHYLRAQSSLRKKVLLSKYSFVEYVLEGFVTVTVVQQSAVLHNKEFFVYYTYSRTQLYVYFT